MAFKILAPPEPEVIFLDFLQPLQLAPAQAAVLPAPSLVALLRDPDLAHRIGGRHAVPMQQLDLPQLSFVGVNVAAEQKALHELTREAPRSSEGHHAPLVVKR